MIKPYEILNATRTLGPPLRLRIYTESGLGSGGFLFSYDSDGAEIDGMNVYIRLSGKYLNPFGPFKKEFSCYIEFRVEPPYDWKNKENQKESYKYCFSRRERFRGSITSRRAEEYCETLLKRAADYFQNNQEYYSVGDDDNNSEYKVQFYVNKGWAGEIITRQL